MTEQNDKISSLISKFKATHFSLRLVITMKIITKMTSRSPAVSSALSLSISKRVLPFGASAEGKEILDIGKELLLLCVTCLSVCSTMRGLVLMDLVDQVAVLAVYPGIDLVAVYPGIDLVAVYPGIDVLAVYPGIDLVAVYPGIDLVAWYPGIDVLAVYPGIDLVAVYPGIDLVAVYPGIDLLVVCSKIDVWLFASLVLDVCSIELSVVSRTAWSVVSEVLLVSILVVGTIFVEVSTIAKRRRISVNLQIIVSSSNN